MALRQLCPALAIGVLLVAAPSAAAHSSQETADGKYRIVVGLVDEPVVTGQKTGLDLCFTLNDTARSPVALRTVDDVTAVVKAPDGQALNGTLASQHGRPGCYHFSVPFILTMPGQYTVSLKGAVGKNATSPGTAIDFPSLNAGGAVRSGEAVRFPATQTVQAEDVQEEVRALRERVALLEAQAAAAPDEGEQFAPVAPLGLLAVGLLALSFTRRSRGR